eukprot:438408_1
MKAAVEQSRAHSELAMAKVVAEQYAMERQVAEKKEVSARMLLGAAADMARENSQLQYTMGREAYRRKQLHNAIEDLKGRIRVYVRVRPMSKSEVERGCANVVQVKGPGKLSVQDPKVRKGEAERLWEFDKAFIGAVSEGNSQEAMFADTKRHLLERHTLCLALVGLETVLTLRLVKVVKSVVLSRGHLWSYSG